MMMMMMMMMVTLVAFLMDCRCLRMGLVMAYFLIRAKH